MVEADSLTGAVVGLWRKKGSVTKPVIGPAAAADGAIHSDFCTTINVGGIASLRGYSA
jgi:hypothetical protein